MSALVNVKEIVAFWTDEHGDECSETENGNFIVTINCTNMGAFYGGKVPGVNPSVPSFTKAIIEWRGATPYIELEK